MTIEEQLGELVNAVRALALVAAVCGTAYLVRWWYER